MTRNVWLSRLAMAALILIIVAGFYWKIVLTKQYSWFGAGEGDISLQVLPWYQFEAREFHNWRFPLWDPHQWVGQPLLGQGQPGAAYPLNWLLFAWPLQHGLIGIGAINWYFVMIHFMAAIFAYALCRDLGCSRWGSLVSGCVFALAGYVGSTDWPQMANGAVWGPLVLLFLLRAVRGQAPLLSAALSGGCLGIAWLSGHHQIPLYITLVVATVWLFYALRGGRVDWHIVRLAAIGFIAMFLISALQTLPEYEYGKLARRWSGPPDPLAWDQKVPYSVHAEYSMPGSSLIAIFIPGLNRHADPFVGVVAFVLALFGYALAWRERAVRLFTAMAICGVLLSLGFHNIFHGILYSVVPLVDKARVPSTAIYIFHLGLVVLIAFGFDAYFSAELKSAWKLRILAGCAVFGFALWALFFQAVLAAKLNFEFEDRLTLTALFAILLAGLLYAFLKGRLSRGHATAALMILLLIELGNDSGYTFRENKGGHLLPPKFEATADIAQFLKQQPGPFRIDTESEELAPNFGDWYGIDALSGFGASVLSNVYSFEWPSDRGKMLLNVAYYVGKKPVAWAPEQVFEGSSGLKVYRNPQAFPRMWTVHEVALVKNVDESNYYMGRADFDGRRKATIQAPAPPLGSCDPAQDKVRTTARNARTTTFEAELACDGLLVISESYFPGWKVTIDGRPSEIREVFGALRGIPVPQGRHQIRTWYRPRSFIVGATLTLVGVLGICALGFLERRRRRI